MAYIYQTSCKILNPPSLFKPGMAYGHNARKVISELWASLYCSVLSLGGIVNTRQMSQADMRSIFHIKNQWNILVTGNYYGNYQNFQNSVLLSSSDTKRTLMHLFLLTNYAQRELVSICTQSIRNCIQLSLHYNPSLWIYLANSLTIFRRIVHLYLQFELF